MADSSNNLQTNNNESKTNRKPKKLNKSIRFLISLVLILVIGYLIFNYVPFISKYSNHVIVTDSMVPVINVNDVVVIDNSYEINDLNPGDIIAFNVDLNNDGTEEIVVHYLHSFDEETGAIETIAYGQEDPDPWDIDSDDILGKHVLTIENIGSFLRFASSTFGKIILIVDVVVIYFIIDLFTEDDKKNEKATKKKPVDESDEVQDELSKKEIQQNQSDKKM